MEVVRNWIDSYDLSLRAASCILDRFFIAMKKKSLTILCCVHLFVGCNGNKGEVSSFRFSEEIELMADSIHVDQIFTIEQWEVIDELLVILSGEDRPVFLTYSLPNFKFVESFGNMGRGPEEYLFPRIIKNSKGGLFIYDVFNKKFQTLTVFEQGHSIEDAGVLESDFIINELGHIGGGRFHSMDLAPEHLRIKILKINSDGVEELSSYEIAPKNSNTSLCLFSSSNIGNRLAVVYTRKKQVEFYDVDENNQLQKIQTYAEGDYDLSMKHYEAVTSNSHAFYALYQGETWVMNQPASGISTVEIFSKNGEALTQVKLDRPITNIAVDDVGQHLYGTSPLSEDIYIYTLP